MTDPTSPEELEKLAEFLALSLRMGGDYACGMATTKVARIEAALRAIAQEKREAGWRPIETAPRDGTVVMLADAREHIGVGIGAWQAETREVWERVDETTKKFVGIETAGYWNANDGDGVCLGQQTKYALKRQEDAARAALQALADGGRE